MTSVSKDKAVTPESLIFGLRWRLFLLVLVAVVLIFGLIAYDANENRREGIAEIREKADSLVKIASARQMQFIDSARQLLAVLAETPDVKNGDARSCGQLMRDLRERHSFYANLGVISIEGNVWCSGIEFSGPMNLSSRAYFRRAISSKAFAIGNYQIGAITRKGSLNFGYPVLDHAGDVKAVVFAALDLGWMTQLAGETRLPEEATLSVLDSQGTILARFPEPEKWVGQPVPDAPLFQIVQLRSQRAAEFTGPDDVARLYAFNTLGGKTEAGQIYVVVGIPKEAAFREANRALVRNLIWLGTVCLLALAGAWFIGNRSVVGFVSEWAKAEDERQRVLERIRALHEIERATTSTLDLDAILDLLLEKIDLVFPYPVITAVRLVNKETGVLEPVACRHISKEEWMTAIGAIKGSRHSFGAMAMETKAPIVISDIEADPRTQHPEFYRSHGIVSLLGIPLIVKEHALGVLYFYTQEEHQFSNEEIEFLSTLAAQVAIAIHNSQLHEQTRKQAVELEKANEDLKRKEEIQALLKEINQDVTRLDIDTLLKKLTEKVREILRVDVSDVRVLVEGQWRLTGIAGIDPNLVTPSQSGTGRGRAGWIQQHRQPLVMRDLTLSDVPTGTTMKNLGLRSYVGVPLFSRAGDVIGVLRGLTYQPRDFTQEEVDLLQQLANGAAVALENAKLLEEIKKSNTAKDELLDVMARQKEELERLNAGLEREIAERGRARAEIAAKNRDLETLLYVTSHDLREPLRAIENFSRMVNDRYSDRLDDKGKDFLRRVIQGSQRLNRLLEDILILSRSQRMAVPNEEVEGETIVLEALKRLDAKISATRAQIQVAKDFHGLRVDKTWATQAVYNLIANALKFTCNGEAPDVEIAPYQPQGPGSKVIGFAVRDRGPGVASEHAERIFQLFQRGVGREVEGTGAGLAIVRQIAERHGGSAWVEAREGGGSEFIITFGQDENVKGDTE